MLWLMLFLDLATLPNPKAGDDSLYRQAMADHHLKGGYDLAAGSAECAQIAADSNGEMAALQPPFVDANRGRVQPAASAPVHFSFVGWSGNLALVQLKTSDALSCVLYQRSGASFRLVREIRFHR